MHPTKPAYFEFQPAREFSKVPLSSRSFSVREAMAQALSLGTRDAMLFYHAGMIALAIDNVFDATLPRTSCGKRSRRPNACTSGCIAAVRSAVPPPTVLKVIIESAVLTDEEIADFLTTAAYDFID